MWTQSIPTHLKYLTYSTLKYIQTWQGNNKYIEIRHKFKEMSSQPNSCYADGRVSLRVEKACGLGQPRCQHHLLAILSPFCQSACLPACLTVLYSWNDQIQWSFSISTNFLNKVQFDDHIPKLFFFRQCITKTHYFSTYTSAVCDLQNTNKKKRQSKNN